MRIETETELAEAVKGANGPLRIKGGGTRDVGAPVVGEVLEEGAKDAAGAVADGAAKLEQEIEEGDTETPGPAPILGDELNADQADPND